MFVPRIELNVDMDLEPFGRINPCGLLDTMVTHMAAFRTVDIAVVKRQLLHVWRQTLGCRWRISADRAAGVCLNRCAAIRQIYIKEQNGAD